MVAGGFVHRFGIGRSPASASRYAAKNPLRSRDSAYPSSQRRRKLGLFEPLREKIAAGLPTFGTCAGLILLAKTIKDDPTVHFGLLDATVERNAYGRQLGSFHAKAPFANGPAIPLSFIRAPAIRALGPSVETLATVDGIPVAVRQANLLATAFHPELDPDQTVHRAFLAMCHSSFPS